MSHCSLFQLTTPAISVFFFLSEPRACHQLSQPEVMCDRSAQSFGKTRTHIVGHFVDLSCLLKGANTKRAFSALFLGLKDSGSFHVALTQTHTG